MRGRLGSLNFISWMCAAACWSRACSCAFSAAILGQHLAGQLGHGARAQALQVLGFERVHIEHGLIVRSLGDGRHRGILELPQRYLAKFEWAAKAAPKPVIRRRHHWSSQKNVDSRPGCAQRTSNPHSKLTRSVGVRGTVRSSPVRCHRQVSAEPSPRHPTDARHASVRARADVSHAQRSNGLSQPQRTIDVVVI